jgi:hypothetical protein
MIDDFNNENSQKKTDQKNNDQNTFKFRIFRLFYNMLRKEDLNTAVCVLFLLIEMAQMVSYSFSQQVYHF